MLEALSELDQLSNTTGCFGKASNNHWKRRVAPDLEEKRA
jgi:hypothetical protein